MPWALPVFSVPPRLGVEMALKLEEELLAGEVEDDVADDELDGLEDDVVFGAGVHAASNEAVTPATSSRTADRRSMPVRYRWRCVEDNANGRVFGPKTWGEAA